jgi:hypothetical protein
VRQPATKFGNGAPIHPNAGNVVLDQLQTARTGWPSTSGSADTAAYSAKTGLMICCPMTTRSRAIPSRDGIADD